jgi:hypothetical protein
MAWTALDRAQEENKKLKQAKESFDIVKDWGISLDEDLAEAKVGQLKVALDRLSQQRYESGVGLQPVYMSPVQLLPKSRGIRRKCLISRYAFERIVERLSHDPWRIGSFRQVRGQ